MGSVSYKDLVVWEKSFQLAVDVYQITAHFPKSELYGITSQMRRAAFSIPANIAEGQSRHYEKEFIQFLSIASGSAAELETFLLLSLKLEFLSQEEFDRLSNLLSEVRRMLYVIIRTLKSKN